MQCLEKIKSKKHNCNVVFGPDSKEDVAKNIKIPDF